MSAKLLISILVLVLAISSSKSAAIEPEPNNETPEDRLNLPVVDSVLKKAPNPACLTPVQQEKAVEIANAVTDIVAKALEKGGAVFDTPEKKIKYTDVTGRVIEALKAGWAKPDAIDAISSAIADPLKEIPKVGKIISSGVKLSVKALLLAKKKADGC